MTDFLNGGEKIIHGHVFTSCPELVDVNVCCTCCRCHFYQKKRNVKSNNPTPSPLSTSPPAETLAVLKQTRTCVCFHGFIPSGFGGTSQDTQKCHLFATWLHPRGRTTMWNKHQRSRTDGTLVTSAREAPFCSGMTRLPAPREADSTRPPLQTLIAQVPPGRPEVLPGHGAQLQEPPNQGPVFGWSSLQARPSTSPCYRRNHHAKVIPSSVGQQPPGFSLPCGDEGG